MGDVADFGFWLAVGFLFLGLAFGPIGKGVARLIEALAARVAGGASAAELETLARRVEELDGVDRRLLELEERLDFAERLLTSGGRTDHGGIKTPPESVAAT